MELFYKPDNVAEVALEMMLYFPNVKRPPLPMAYVMTGLLRIVEEDEHFLTNVSPKLLWRLLEQLATPVNREITYKLLWSLRHNWTFRNCRPVYDHLVHCFQVEFEDHYRQQCFEMLMKFDIVPYKIKGLVKKLCKLPVDGWVLDTVKRLSEEEGGLAYIQKYHSELIDQIRCATYGPYAELAQKLYSQLEEEDPERQDTIISIPCD